MQTLSKNKTLYPYQLSAIDKLSVEGNHYLNADAGTGKTAISLFLLENYSGTCVVLCESSLTKVWSSEAGSWSEIKKPVAVFNKKHLKLSDYQGKTLVVSYGMIGKIELDAKIDVLIIDEAHNFSNPQRYKPATDIKIAKGAKRCAELTIVASSARKIIALSGTPLLERPKNLWFMLNLLGFYKESWSRYAVRYCKAHIDPLGYWNVNGASNLPELKQLLDKKFITIKKADVLDLPNKLIAFYGFSGEGEISRTVLDDFVQMGLSQGFANYRTPKNSHFMKEITQSGMALAELALNHYIQPLINRGERFIAFYMNTEVGEYLQTKLNCDRICGGQSPKQKHDIIEKFKTGGDVLLINIKAGGTGLNLQFVSRVIFVQLPWNTGIMNQCINRVHRIGQAKQVKVDVLYKTKSTYERMLYIIFSKAKTRSILDR